MTVSSGPARRQVVPRWRPWRLTASLGEAAATSRAELPSTYDLASLVEDYRDQPHLGRAADLLAVASAYGERNASVLAIAGDVAREAAGTPLGELAQGYLDGDQERFNKSLRSEPIDSQKRLHQLREILAREPRNALRWMDLAREHLILGNPGSARRAVHAALHLAPEDRFVLRSATAFLTHQGEPEEARVLLERSRRTRHDPWLLASLIAVEDLSKSKHKSGRLALRLLDGDFADAQIAELAAAMGTVEFSAGSERRGRQMLRRSVNDPNENALAQVEWLSVSKNREIAETKPDLVPRAFEARARRAESEGRWEDAVDATRLWIIDQPFSVEAAVFGSFVASEAHDWDTCQEFAREGLRSNPDSPSLLNNLAYAQVRTGDMKDATGTLEKARKTGGTKDQLLTLAATEALLLFRIGLSDEGRKRYEAVINGFNKTHEHEHAAKAALMLAHEELAASTEHFEVAWRRAVHLSRDTTRMHVRGLKEMLARTLRGEIARECHPAGRQQAALQELAAPLLPEPTVLAD